jgi:hypothetical protein
MSESQDELLEWARREKMIVNVQGATRCSVCGSNGGWTLTRGLQKVYCTEHIADVIRALKPAMDFYPQRG